VTGTHTYAEPGEYDVVATVYSPAATSHLALAATVTAVEPIVNITPPTVTGEARVGSTLTATPGEWDAEAPTFAYQWTRDGEPVDGATAATYRLTAADAGRSIAVTVTATADGALPGTAVSDRVTVAKVASRISGSTNRVFSIGGNGFVFAGTVGATGITPAGAVTVYDGSRAIGTAQVDAQGRYRVTLPKLGRGVHLLTARFGGGDQLLPVATPPRPVVVL